MGATLWKCRRSHHALAIAASHASTALEGALRAIVDFAVTDACCACGSKTGSPPAREGLPPATRRLAGATVVPLLGPFTVVNHPFCRACLARFEQCDGPARIGVCGASQEERWVRTCGGEVFVHYGPTVESLDSRPSAPVALEVYSPFRMNDASLELVRLIKFSRRKSLVPLASASMAWALSALASRRSPPVLVPVPMHPSARRRRGFNQAELLAQGVAAAAGAPVVQAIRKTAPTPPQSKTGHVQRAENVRSTFQPSGPPVAGRHVCLVDDLVTTGATAAACAAAALAAGAREVTVLCLARTP
jgi:ComF family protein